MRWLRLGILEELSPIEALTAGLAIGSVAMPVLGKGLRALAYTTVKGAIAVTDKVRDSGETVKKEWNNIVAEALAQRQIPRKNIENNLIGTGIDVAKAGMELVDEVKDAVSDVKENLGDAAGKTGEVLKAAAAGAVSSALEAIEGTPDNLDDNSIDIATKKEKAD